MLFGVTHKYLHGRHISFSWKLDSAGTQLGIASKDKKSDVLVTRIGMCVLIDRR